MLDVAAPRNRLTGCTEKRWTSAGVCDVGGGTLDVTIVVGRDGIAAAAPGGARVLGRLRGGDASLSGEGLGDCGGSPEDMVARIWRLEGGGGVLLCSICWHLQSMKMWNAGRGVQHSYQCIRDNIGA